MKTPQEFRLELGLRLRELREGKKLTRAGLSNILQIPINTIRAAERGKMSPSLPNLVSYADFYKVSVDYLLGRWDKKG